jgi:hypothetical protein
MGRFFDTSGKFFVTENLAKVVHLAAHFRASEGATIRITGKSEIGCRTKKPGKTPQPLSSRPGLFQMSLWPHRDTGGRSKEPHSWNLLNGETDISI